MFPSPLSLPGSPGWVLKYTWQKKHCEWQSSWSSSVGCLCWNSTGLPSPVALLNSSWSNYPIQEVKVLWWAVARAPALAGRLHKPCFSAKAAKNSHGGCRLPLPGLFYIAAALGLSPRPCTVPGTQGREGWGWAATSQHHSWARATGGALCSALGATALTGSLPSSCGIPIPWPTSRAARKHR